LLSACSPQLNWRTVQSPEQRYTALFPGKPDKLDRSVSFEGQELKQTLEAVKIEQDIYSISSIQVPADQARLVKKILDQLQANLLNRAKDSGGIALIEDGFYQTASNQRTPVKDFFLLIKSKDNDQQLMRVRWIARPSQEGAVWIYQLSLLQTKANLDDVKFALTKEEYANFFNEFRPE
jgi:hypothetical protein